MVELQKRKVSTVAKKQMAEKSLKTEYLFGRGAGSIPASIPATI